ncbi:phage tail assembly chaperone protein [Caudoviricetes sp.]|nr:phage tail assembly chaperone protein [Caudoviricetes sp.]UOF81506.1 phage tail assembly chaperone protein [Caudoviricetes sp.]
MANKARGYSDIKIGAETFTVCLGIGALAEIENEFGVESFEEALNFGEDGKVSARRLLKFMHGLMRGNGIDLTPSREKELGAWTPQEFMDMITELLQSSGFSAQQDAQPKADKRPLAARNAGRRG